MASSEAGDLLAIANLGGDTVTMLRVTDQDELLHVVGSPFATGRTPASVAFGRNDDLLATADRGGDTISAFAVGHHGQLTPLRGSPFATGKAPSSVAFLEAGKLLAVANQGGNGVSVFERVFGRGRSRPARGSHQHPPVTRRDIGR